MKKRRILDNSYCRLAKLNYQSFIKKKSMLEIVLVNQTCVFSIQFSAQEV